MNKSRLLEIGLTEEQVEKVLSIFDGDFISKSRFNTLLETNKSLKEQLELRDEQLKQLKKDHQVSDELRETIKALQDQNEKTKQEYEMKISDMILSNGIEMGVVKSGAILPKAVISYLDKTKLSLDENGEVKGLSEQLETLKQGDTSILFRSSVPKKEGYVPESSIPNKSTSGKNKEEMTYDELCRIYEL